ncbi:hypothetical protein EMIT0357P_20653 [Pseudomonas marginalis]
MTSCWACGVGPDCAATARRTLIMVNPLPMRMTERRLPCPAARRLDADQWRPSPRGHDRARHCCPMLTARSPHHAYPRST